MTVSINFGTGDDVEVTQRSQLFFDVNGDLYIHLEMAIAVMLIDLRLIFAGDFTATGEITAYSIYQKTISAEHPPSKILSVRGVTFTRTDIKKILTKTYGCYSPRN